MSPSALSLSQTETMFATPNQQTAWAEEKRQMYNQMKVMKIQLERETSAREESQVCEREDGCFLVFLFFFGCILCNKNSNDTVMSSSFPFSLSLPSLTLSLSPPPPDAEGSGGASPQAEQTAPVTHAEPHDTAGSDPNAPEVPGHRCPTTQLLLSSASSHLQRNQA